MPKPSARSPSITSQESYSAVIIADLVAEVRVPPDCEPVEKMRSPSLKSKEETNFGYDGQMDTDESRPGMIKTDTTEAINRRMSKTNGPGISKGVILNAMQFVHPDSNLKAGSEKQMQLSNSLPIPVSESKEPSKTAQSPSSFSEMSLSRKVAFGFSFLPSILFVLCFAVILPCEKPPMCVQDQWMIEFNNSDVTSKLQISQNVIFILSKDGENNITSIDETSGKILWNRSLGTGIRHLDCGNVQNSDTVDCVVLDEVGRLHSINGSNGEVLWNRDISENGAPSLFTILPDCNNDGTSEIGMAVSKTKIKVLIKGYKAFLIDVSGCDSTPSKLIAWPRKNTTDLIYICKKGENETLFTIPQNQWCINDQKLEKEARPLFSSYISLNDSSILTTQDEVILWVEDEVYMIRENGTMWSASTLPHSNNNRFLLHGKFGKEGTQIALISSDLSTNFRVTTLNSLTGNTTWSHVKQSTEVTDVAYIQGEKKDYALILMKMVKKDLTSEAVVHFNEMSTSIMHFITKEEINGSKVSLATHISEEIALMPLDESNRVAIEEKDMLDSYGSSQQLAATVTSNSKESKLKAFVLSKLRDGATQRTQLKRIDVSNWDISTGKTQTCIWN